MREINRSRTTCYDCDGKKQECQIVCKSCHELLFKKTNFWDEK